jgi:hypothetical protein
MRCSVEAVIACWGSVQIAPVMPHMCLNQRSLEPLGRRTQRVAGGQD